MEFHEKTRIKAIGNLLQYYESDLVYIRNFRRFREGRIEGPSYLSTRPGTFRSFLNEYRVARNRKRGETESLLSTILDWVKSPRADDVDGLAKMIRNVTFEKTMTSLASKILFLNNPSVIVPCDSLNRAALGLKLNEYGIFRSRMEAVRDKHLSEIAAWLAPVEEYLTLVESGFHNEIESLGAIRVNRFVDKLLWVKGLEIKLKEDTKISEERSLR